MTEPVPPRVTSVAVKNYRALRDVTLPNLTPLTVLLGPNGSGKSTVFDVFAFLSECFTDGIRKAWDRRGRFRELRSRGSDGPVAIELKYRERPRTPLITYHLEIDEDKRAAHRRPRVPAVDPRRPPRPALQFHGVQPGRRGSDHRGGPRERRHEGAAQALGTGRAGRQHPRHARRESPGGCPSRVHHDLASLLSLRRRGAGQCRSGRRGTAVSDRRQPRQRGPASP